MATFDYSRSQETVKRLLIKFGTTGILTHYATGKGWNPGPPVTHKFQVRVAMLPASKGTIEAFDIRLDENLIMDNVRYGIMEARMTKIEGPSDPASVVPNPTDQFEVNGELLTIIGSTPLNPAGIPVYFPFAGRV